MKIVTRSDRRVLIQKLEERLLIKWNAEKREQQLTLPNKQTYPHLPTRKYKLA